MQYVKLHMQLWFSITKINVDENIIRKTSTKRSAINKKKSTGTHHWRIQDYILKLVQGLKGWNSKKNVQNRLILHNLLENAGGFQAPNMLWGWSDWGLVSKNLSQPDTALTVNCLNLFLSLNFQWLPHELYIHYRLVLHN